MIGLVALRFRQDFAILLFPKPIRMSLTDDERVDLLVEILVNLGLQLVTGHPPKSAKDRTFWFTMASPVGFGNEPGGVIRLGLKKKPDNTLQTYFVDASTEQMVWLQRHLDYDPDILKVLE